MTRRVKPKPGDLVFTDALYTKGEPTCWAEEPSCRGCDEPGWQGLIDGSTGKRYHERTVAPGFVEMIPCSS